jgi:mRNA interferase MazF
MASGRAITTPKRGEIYLVNFDQKVGPEAKKTRPALVIQNDIANRHSSLTIVCAIRSQYEGPLYPTEVLIAAPEGGMKVNSVVLGNQTRSVDKRRLVRRLSWLRADTMERVGRAVRLSLSLVAI